MAEKALHAVVEHTRRLVAVEAAEGMTDGALLERFVRNRDEAAFTVLVQRHAAMVLGLCRRMLRHGQDAEDASQATFLALARNARSIRKRTALASWLYGVAYRVACKHRTAQARRRAREERPRTLPCTPARDVSWVEVQAVLDAALAALPEKYRAPLVLCYLQERTRDEAAHQLGLPLSTLRGRLELGRDMLRSQLARRGITLSGALLLAALTESASAAVTAGLVAAAVRVAVDEVVASSVVQALATSAAKSMVPGKAGIAAAVLVVLGLGLGAGTTVIGRGDETAPPIEQTTPVAEEQRQPQPGEIHELRDLYGDPLPPNAVARLGTVRFRPGGYVDTVAFTPDGEQLVSYGWSGVNVWDAATGRELKRHMPEADVWLSAGLLSPDGKSVVTVESVGQVRSIRIRKRSDLKPIRAFPVQLLESPRLTPDGKRLIGLGGDGKGVTVEVWDLQDGKRLRSWNAHEGHVWHVDLSRDGKSLATGGADKVIRIWNVETGTLIREWAGLPNVVGRLALSPDGKLLAALAMHTIKSGSVTIHPWENRIRIWEVASGKEIGQLTMNAKGDTYGHPPGFSALIFAPDGRQIVTAGLDGVVRIWATATAKEVRQFAVGRANVSTLSFAPDGQTVAVAGSAIRLFDWTTGKEKVSQFGHLFGVFSVAVAPDGRSAATGAEGHIQLWDVGTGRPSKRLDGHDQTVATLHWSGDGSLLSAGMDKKLRVWDLGAGKERRHLDLPDVGLGPLAIAHDGRTVAVLKDRAIHLLEPATGKEQQRLPMGDKEVAGAAFPRDDRTLVVWYSDHSAQVWDVANAKALRQFAFAEARAAGRPRPVAVSGRTGWAYAAALSPDGRLIAYGSQDSYLAIHETQTGRIVRFVDNLVPDGAGTLAFGPDSRSLAWSGWRRPVIHVFELASGKERLRLEGHKGRVTSLAYSANGRTLLSGSEDTTALVWDVAGRQAVPSAVVNRAAAWRDLASDDAALAFATMRRLAAAPADAVALVHQHIKPIAAPDAKRLVKLIADLDSANFDARAAAGRELDNVGETAVAACRTALKGSPSVELRRRLEELIAKHTRGRWSPSPDQLRRLRAVEVLEMASTPECRAALEELANGAAGVQLTEEARATLRRATKR